MTGHIVIGDLRPRVQFAAAKRGEHRFEIDAFRAPSPRRRHAAAADAASATSLITA